ncbi:transposase [Pandoraea capi]|uniref:Transposase n=2 Tax=Pandoraea capi TaxID=2508286 RepID=A0ABY6W7F9_9BURK|nr:transposase [Pandoraea capi]
MSARFDLREAASVSRWQRQYHEGGIHALEPRPKGRRPSVMSPLSPSAPPPKENDTRTREELLEELEYLRAENTYLKKLDALLKQKEQGQYQTGQKKKRK